MVQVRHNDELAGFVTCGGVLLRRALRERPFLRAGKITAGTYPAQTMKPRRVTAKPLNSEAQGRAAHPGFGSELIPFTPKALNIS